MIGRAFARRLLLATAAAGALCALSLPAGWFYRTFVCAEVVSEGPPSPDGTYRLQIRQEDCGATTSYVTEVVLSEA
jgi:hypothetical protein